MTPANDNDAASKYEPHPEWSEWMPFRSELGFLASALIALIEIETARAVRRVISIFRGA